MTSSQQLMVSIFRGITNLNTLCITSDDLYKPATEEAYHETEEEDNDYEEERNENEAKYFNLE